MANARQKQWAALVLGALTLMIGLQGVASGGLSDQAGPGGGREIDMVMLSGSTVLCFAGYLSLRWAVPRLLARAPRA